MVSNETVGKLARMSSKATKSTWVSRNTMKVARLATTRAAYGLIDARLRRHATNRRS